MKMSEEIPIEALRDLEDERSYSVYYHESVRARNEQVKAKYVRPSKCERVVSSNGGEIP